MSTASPLEARNVTAVRSTTSTSDRVVQQLGEGALQRSCGQRVDLTLDDEQRVARVGLLEGHAEFTWTGEGRGIGGVEQRRSPPTVARNRCAGAVVAAPGRAAVFSTSATLSGRPRRARARAAIEARWCPNGDPEAASPTAGRWPRGARTAPAAVHGRRLRTVHVTAPARCTDGAGTAVHGGAIPSARPGCGVPQRTAVSCRVRGRALRWPRCSGQTARVGRCTRHRRRTPAPRRAAHGARRRPHDRPAAPPGRLRQPRRDRADGRTRAAARRHRRLERRRRPHRPRRTADERDRLAAVARRGGRAGGG